MSYEPLHHKYRPQTFANLVGQSAIATTLSYAIEQSKIAPAYLFTGPRGTGKTSSARILAKSLNCLSGDRPTPTPCGKCEVCQAIARGSALDVMEIDAASNTGVDNIREIIERCQFAPVQSRYKVYSIDECHMLSTAAFNALLKTLEEPPDKVVFVLATTDPQRVLPTIISRCQRFDFRRIPLAAMVSHLKYIASQENIKIDEAAITLVAQIANGGLRDAESLLDQLSLLPETITVEQVWDLVGSVPEQDLLALLKAIAANKPEVVIEYSRNLFDRGREPLVILQNLAGFYLNLLIAKTAAHRPDLVAVTETTWKNLCTQAQQWDTREILRGQQHLKEAEVQIRNTTQPRLWLEVTLLGLLPSASLPSSVPGNLEQEIQKQDINKTVPLSAKTTALEGVVSINQTPTSTTKNDSANSLAIPNHSQTQPKKEETISSSTVTSVSQPAAEIIPEAPVEPEINLSLQAVWKKAIDHLQPPTTQALFKQKCHLISLQGSVAIVGISSPQLLKLNQGKIPNLEAAFTQACQRTIKIKLETGVSQTETPPEVTIPPPPQPQTLVESTEKKTLTPEINLDRSVSVAVKPQITKELEKEEKKQVTQVEKTVEIINKPAENLSSIELGQEQFNISVETLEQNYNLSDTNENLQQAIDYLVKSFEGEIVDLNRFVAPEITKIEVEESEVDNLVKPYKKLSNIDKNLNYLGSNRPDLSKYKDEEDVPF